MRLFCASLLHETLTPDAKETTKEDFAKCYLKYSGEHHKEKMVWFTPIYLWKDLCQQNHIDFIESLAALAAPSGPVNKSTFEEFCENIIDDLKRHHTSINPINFILLNLHGAMVATGYDDCEGYLLERIRKIVGDTVYIGVLMDLHGHHTDMKSHYADAIIYYHEYPHTDTADRAHELFNVILKTTKRNCQPKICSFNTYLLNHMLTLQQPMRCIVDFMKQQVNPRNGIELASIAHGFPWGDVPQSGVTPVIIYNEQHNNAKKFAQEFAEILGLILYALRNETKPQTVTLEQALQIVAQHRKLHTSKPIVLADYADNPGGGALGCSTFALKQLLTKQISHTAISSLYDEAAVKIAFRAGIDQEIEIDIGGSHDPKQQIYYGNPLHIKARVMALQENFHDEFAGGPTDKGHTARLTILAYFDGQHWLQQNNCDVIINSLREQTFSPKCFTAFNIDITNKDLLLVKSMYHYQAGFLKFTDPQNFLTLEINGRLSPDFRTIKYQKLKTNQIWPFVSKIPEFDKKLEKLLEEKNPLLMQFLQQLTLLKGNDYVEKYFPKNIDPLKSNSSLTHSRGLTTG